MVAAAEVAEVEEADGEEVVEEEEAVEVAAMDLLVVTMLRLVVIDVGRETDRRILIFAKRARTFEVEKHSGS